MARPIGFESNRTSYKGQYEDYIGEWVRIYTHMGNLEMGLLSEIRNGLLVLSPHMGIRASNEYGPLRKFCKTRLGNSIPVAEVGTIEPSSMKDLLNQIEFMNSQQIRGIKKANQNNK